MSDQRADDGGTSRSSAFQGVRIIEIARGVAAPYATMLLADHGADVIKLEPPEGDVLRGEPGFEALNRNKRSAVVDVQTNAGRSLASELVRRAQVVVTDTTDIANTAVGLDHRSVRALAPQIVSVQMPTWGQLDEPPPASTRLIHAATGIATGQHSYTGNPIDLVFPLSAYGAGALGAIAIVAGLVRQARFGTGSNLTVSELAGAAAMQLSVVRPGTDPPEELEPNPMGSAGLVPVYRPFEAGDGKWFFLACGTPRFYEQMLGAIGREDLLSDSRLVDPPFGLREPSALEVIWPILDQLFRTEPRDHWLGLFLRHDVPSQPIQTREEFLRTELARANRMQVSVDDGRGSVVVPNTPLVLTATPGGVRSRAPALGQHTDEVTAIVDEPLPARVAPAATDGGEDGPLSGIRVVDLSSFIAGPVISRHLASLGAEVVKVEPPTGDPFRILGEGFLSWNRGKRSIAVDLRSEPGQAVLRGLVAHTDIVIDNFRPGVGERLGVDPTRLREISPDVITLSSPGYGADESMSARPAFDPLVQALGGAMAAQGGDDEPVFLSVPVHDVMTPMLGAFGCLGALYHRLRTGEGQHVRTSLTQSTAAIQMMEMAEVDGVSVGRVGGWDHPGPTVAQRWYEAEDGRWLVVDAATDAERAALAKACEVDERVVREPIDGPGYDEAVDVVRAAIAERPLDEWLGRLADEGVPAVAVSHPDPFDHELVASSGLVEVSEHPARGTRMMFGPLIDGADVAVRRCPLLSEHAVEVLAELGYTSAQVDDLFEAGAVRPPTPT